MTLKKSDLNCEVKSVIVSGHAGVIWMISNPATGSVTYRMELDGGAFVTSGDLDKVIDIYNRREAK